MCAENMGISLAILLLLYYACSSSVVPVPSDSTKTLEYYLCNDDGQQELVPGTVLQLASNITHVINQGQGCTIKNITNLTITSIGLANIACQVPFEYRINEVRGFVFLGGSDITLSNLHITQCGTALTSSMLQLDNDTKSSAYFGTNQTATLLFSHVHRLKIVNVQVSDYYGFAIIVANSFGLSLIDNMHVYNSLSSDVCKDLVIEHGNHSCYGSGMLIYFHNLYDEVDELDIGNDVLLIEHSEFNDNTYFTDDFRCIFSIFRFQPSRVPLVAAAAITVYFTQDTYKVLVQLDTIEIHGNNGRLSGGLMTFFIDTPFQSYLLLKNSTIENNKNTFFPCVGTGVLVQIFFTNAYLDAAETNNTFNFLDTWIPLSVVNTAISYHQGYKRGSTFYIGQNSQRLFNVEIELDRVKFLHNSASYNGICLYMETTYQPMSNSKLLMIKLRNVLVYNNSQAGGVAIRTTSSHIVFFRIGRATIEGIQPYNSSFVNNFGTVITAFNSEVYLKGIVNFMGNTASDGAGITLRSSSFLILADNSSILFQENKAFDQGGAIHAIQEGTELFYCLVQVDSDKRYNISELNINVTFVANEALHAGNTMFIRPLYRCFQSNLYVSVSELRDLYSEIFYFHQSDISNEIASSSSYICHCNVSSSGFVQPLCDIQYNTVFVYPGDTVSVNLVAIDDTGNVVVSQVVASLSTRISPVDPIPGWYIPPIQEINTIPMNQCQTFNYTIMSNLSWTKGQLNFRVPRRPALSHAPIELLPCPTGMHLVDSMCQCKPYFDYLGLECDQRTKQIYFKSREWVGIVHSANDSYFAHARYCPVGYCDSSYTAISVTDTNSSICIGNRKGVLCGTCKEGYSALHGGFGCAICNNYSILLLLVNFAVGLMVILALYILNLTLNVGTLGGIVFYANVFNFVKTIPTSEIYFFPFLQVVGIVNLIQAFPVCLYDGMVYAINMYIHFGYSIFLWSIVVIITIIARYSNRLSHILSSSSVQVFMTLIHLSFAKILFATIEILSFAEIRTENGNHLVWLYNGSVPYGTGIHIPLILLAIIFTVCVTIPYVILGLFGSFCLRFHQVNKFRPFIDTIHGPYKDKQRAWFGARLVLLVLLSLINVTLRGQDPFYQLLLQLTLVLVYTFVQAYVHPFEKTNINILDLWCMINVLVVILINLYNSYADNNVAQFLLIPELMIINVTIFCIIGFHVYQCIKKRNCCRKKTTVLQNAADDKIKSLDDIVSVPVTTSTIQGVTETDETWFQLREPLIEVLDK